MTITEAELLTVDETAGLLKVNAQTVRNWIDRGELPALRVGGRRVRIQRAALEAFIGVQIGKSDGEAAATIYQRGLSVRQRESAAGLLEQIATDLQALAAILRSESE